MPTTIFEVHCPKSLGIDGTQQGQQWMNNFVKNNLTAGRLWDSSTLLARTLSLFMLHWSAHDPAQPAEMEGSRAGLVVSWCVPWSSLDVLVAQPWQSLPNPHHSMPIATHPWRPHRSLHIPENPTSHRTQFPSNALPSDFLRAVRWKEGGFCDWWGFQGCAVTGGAVRGAWRLAWSDAGLGDFAKVERQARQAMTMEHADLRLTWCYRPSGRVGTWPVGFDGYDGFWAAGSGLGLGIKKTNMFFVKLGAEPVDLQLFSLVASVSLVSLWERNGFKIAIRSAFDILEPSSKNWDFWSSGFVSSSLFWAIGPELSMKSLLSLIDFCVDCVWLTLDWFSSRWLPTFICLFLFRMMGCL